MHITDEEISIIYECTEPADYDIFNITVGSFIEYANDPKKLISDDAENEEDIVESIAKVKGFNEAVKNVFEYIAQYEVKSTEEEKRAGKGVEFPSFFETMLIECVDWFNLHSFDEAENIKMGDWFLYKKSVLAKAKYENNYTLIMDAKHKTK